MSQKAQTSVFIFSEFINIVSKPFFSSKLESLPFHVKTFKNSLLLAFYINNIFEALKTYSNIEKEKNTIIDGLF